MLNELVFHGTVSAHLAGRRITAVEAHKRIGKLIIELALDLFFKEACGNRVVDIQKSDCIFGDAGSDVLAQGTVNIHFAGYRNTPGSQTGVHIAGLKAELLRECRPAFICKSNILACTLVLLCPVKQSELKLCHTLQHIGIISALAHLVLHIFAYSGDSLITGVGFVGDKKVKLGVLLDLNAEFIQAFDRRIAGKEVLRAGTESDDLQILDADYGTGNREKLLHLNSSFFCSDNGIGRDVALQMAHTKVVRAVEHTAISITAAVDQVSVTFCGCNKHHRAVKFFCKKRLRSLRTKVSEEHDKGIAAGCFYISNGIKHILFIFNGDFALINAFAISLYNCFSASDGETDRETVTGNGNNTKFYFRNILHSVFSSHFNTFYFRSGAISTFLPSMATTAPAAASLLSRWASSHLLQAQRSLSSSFTGVISGFGPFVPFGRTTRTLKPSPFAALQGA